MSIPNASKYVIIGAGIGAFIGTEDLGQYIMKALSDLKGGGKGLILGLCVAFIGLAVDNLIRTWAERRKQLLGLS